jgi:hypothetical protein
VPNPEFHAKVSFKKLQILPLPCVYIFSIIKLLINNSTILSDKFSGIQIFLSVSVSTYYTGIKALIWVVSVDL